MNGKAKIWFLAFFLILAGFFAIFFFKTSFTISQVVDWANTANILPFSTNLPQLPKENPDRINILLLGNRGLKEEGEGKLLSDSIILLSIKKSAGQIALISLPRDLYVRLWCLKENKKINFAYAYGGLDCAKKTVSLVTDLYIDYAISVDFKALKETIDALGGITVYLDEPFEEDFQWAKEGWEEDEHWFIKEIDNEERWVFYVSEGENHLDGQTALYYVRSRYSTSDFDRMRRQQQVLVALKEKALSLEVLINPIKIYTLLDVLGKNVRTDIGLDDIKNLIDLSSDLDMKNIKRNIFDTTDEGLLYETFINDEYVLLPVNDNFEQIQEICRGVFD